MCTVVYNYMNYNAWIYNHWMPIQLLLDNIGNIESRCHQKLCLQITNMPLIPRVFLNRAVARYATAYWLKDILRGRKVLNFQLLCSVATLINGSTIISQYMIIARGRTQLLSQVGRGCFPLEQITFQQKAGINKETLHIVCTGFIYDRVQIKTLSKLQKSFLDEESTAFLLVDLSELINFYSP